MRESESDFTQREIDNTLALLVDTRTWIQRRTDKVELIDTYTIRRTIQFEIELPEWARKASSSKDCRLILPIAVFGGGQALRNLDVKVGQEPAGTLTRRAGDRLTRLLRERLRKNGDLGIPEATREFLDSLLGMESGEDGGDRETEGHRRPPDGEKRNYVLFVTSEKSIESEQGASGARFTLAIETDQTLVNELERQPNVIARTLRAIGLGSAANSIELPKGSPPNGAPRRPGFLRRTWSFLFPKDTAFIVAQAISGFGDAGSWQLEVYAPDELRITDGAFLWWPTPEPGEGKEDELPASKGNGRAAPTRRASTAVALTRFRVAADSVTHIGMLIAGASAVLLGVALLIAAYGNTGPIVDAIVAILVIAPSLGSSIVTNPESHEMAGSYLRPHRQRIYSIGVVSAIGAGFFILHGLLSLEAVCHNGDGVSPERCASTLGPFDATKMLLNGEALGDGAPLLLVIAALASLAMIGVALALLIRVFVRLDTMNRDVEARKERSRDLLASEGSELDLSVFVESTSDQAGAGHGKNGSDSSYPLMTLSVDAIDIGPRAIFRLPSATTEPPDERRIKGDPKGAGSSTRKLSLFDRFCTVKWKRKTPPEWFFWAGDIEADFSTEAGFSEEQIRDRLLDDEQAALGSETTALGTGSEGAPE